MSIQGVSEKKVSIKNFNSDLLITLVHIFLFIYFDSADLINHLLFLLAK